jgi:hypothetical protein
MNHPQTKKSNLNQQQTAPLQLIQNNQIHHQPKEVKKIKTILQTILKRIKAQAK